MNFEELVRTSGESLAPLGEAERERMRTLLAEYVAFKPVEPRALTGAQTSWGAFSRITRLFMHPALAGALALFLIVMGTGGAAYAAEGALPGDALYPIKVGVTEPVVTALTPSGKAQVAWHLAIAKRRLTEAAKLKAEGRLATSTEATLASEAADAALTSATLASALPTASATTTVEVASTTATLIKASQLLLLGRDKLEAHDDQGAAKAFHASIHAASGLQVLVEAAGTLTLDDHDDQGATTTPAEGADDSSTTSATSTDHGTPS